MSIFAIDITKHITFPRIITYNVCSYFAYNFRTYICSIIAVDNDFFNEILPICIFVTAFIYIFVFFTLYYEVKLISPPINKNSKLSTLAEGTSASLSLIGAVGLKFSDQLRALEAESHEMW